jgi:hypothetical protein
MDEFHGLSHLLTHPEEVPGLKEAATPTLSSPLDRFAISRSYARYGFGCGIEFFPLFRFYRTANLLIASVAWGFPHSVPTSPDLVDSDY